MRTRPLPVLLVLLAAAPATRPRLQTFNNDEMGFSLKLPADWVVPDHPDPGQQFTARTPPLPTTAPTPGPATTRPARVVAAGSSPAIANVSLKIGLGPDGASDPQILRDASALLAATVFEHGGEHVTLRPGALGRFPARRVRYTVARPDGRAELLTVLAVHHHVTYALTVAAPAGRLNELLPDVDAMLASFDLRE